MNADSPVNVTQPSVFGVKILPAENETTIGISVGRSCRWLCASSELSFDFLGAVVVCHFRVGNPIFHTPFLHHFGVEQYGIT